MSRLALIVVMFLPGIQYASAQNSAAPLETLKQYVGQYQSTRDYVITMTLEGGKLMALVSQATDASTKSELIAESETDFAVKGRGMGITFVKQAQGQVSGIVVHEWGSDTPLPKISSKTDTPVKLIDSSPHTTGFITANGIKMHYLDWGGKGDTLLLLTGFGDNAHVFDDFAAKFTDRFHVIALTRRGFGESDKPKTGYDTDTRVEDIRKFLDALKIGRANIVGHSMAGEELTRFASLYPKRVRNLVYLDSAYDRSKFLECGIEIPGLPPIWKRLFREARDCSRATEIVVKYIPPPDEWNIYVSTQRASFAFQPDYAKVKAPALAIYAVSQKNNEVPPQADEETRKKMEAWWQEEFLPKQRASIEQFRKGLKRGRVWEVKDAHHYLFLGETADEVIRQTREFLSEQSGPANHGAH